MIRVGICSLLKTILCLNLKMHIRVCTKTDFEILMPAQTRDMWFDWKKIELNGIKISKPVLSWTPICKCSFIYDDPEPFQYQFLLDFFSKMPNDKFWQVAFWQVIATNSCLVVIALMIYKTIAKIGSFFIYKI